MMKVPDRWRKSSFSGEQTDCVEVAGTLGAVRDSKNPGPVLAIELGGLLAAVKDGHLSTADGIRLSH